MLANPGSQVLYPFTWLSLALAPQDYYDLYAFAHVLFAGLGAFVLARRLGVSSAAASWPARSSCSPARCSRSRTSGSTSPARPGCRGCSRPATRPSRGPRSGARSPGEGPSPCSCSPGRSTTSCSASWRRPRWPGATSASPGARRRGASRRVAATAAAAALALGLSAAQWVPALELLRGAWRAELGQQARLLRSLHPALLPPGARTRVPARPAAQRPRAPGASTTAASRSSPRSTSARRRCPSSWPGSSRGRGGRRCSFSRSGSSRRRSPWGATGSPTSGRSTSCPPSTCSASPPRRWSLVALAWALLAGLGFDAWAGASRGVRRRRPGPRWRPAWGWPSPGPGGPPGRPAGWPRTPWAGPRRLSSRPCWRPCFPRRSSPRRPRWRSSRAGPPGRPWRCAALVAIVELALAHRDALPSLPRAFFAPTPGLVAAARADGVTRLQIVRLRGPAPGPLRNRLEGRRAGRRSSPSRARCAPRSRGRSTRSTARAGAFAAGSAATWRDSSRAPGSRFTLLVRYHQEDGQRLARLLRLGGVTHLAARHREGLEAFPLRAEVRTVAPGRRVPPAGAGRRLPRAYAAEGVAGGLRPRRLLRAARRRVRPGARGRAAGRGGAPGRPRASPRRCASSRTGPTASSSRHACRGPAELVVLEGIRPGLARARRRAGRRAAGRPTGSSSRCRSRPAATGWSFVYRPPSVGLGLAVTAATALAALACSSGAGASGAGRARGRAS